MTAVLDLDFNAVDGQFRHRPNSLCGPRRGAILRDAVARQNALFQLVAEMPDQTLDRPRRRVAECAYRMAFYLTHDIPQEIDILDFEASPVTRRFIMRYIQPVPSRHGVHWPQLSCM